MKRFTITLTHYHWSCGDGCCSGCCFDSGYKLYVLDNQPERPGYGVVDEDTDWDSNRYPDYLRERAVEKIEEKLGRKAVEGVDYQVVEEDEYGNQDYEE